MLVSGSLIDPQTSKEFIPPEMNGVWSVYGFWGVQTRNPEQPPGRKWMDVWWFPTISLCEDLVHHPVETTTSWWLNQPCWKIWSSNWIISPNRGENKKSLKPPPRLCINGWPWGSRNKYLTSVSVVVWMSSKCTLQGTNISHLGKAGKSSTQKCL